MSKSDRLFLVGPMGAGKTTVGKVLASRLNRVFEDSDAEIVRRTGADITWIFEIEGESGFRDREVAVIDALTKKPDIVLATGGGAVMREENRKALAERGFVVYLRATVKEQVRRTSKDSKRPLLEGRDRRAVLTELMERRDPLYTEVADLILPTAGSNASQLVDEILQAFEA